MTKTRETQLQAIGRLLDITDELREKCPWDKKQTLQSLRHLTIEETYELGDAILENDLAEVKNELGEEVEHGNSSTIESEFGDVLFSMINYARFLKVDPESALERTNKKFIKRFQHLEAKAKDSGRSLQEMTLAEMDVYWEKAKK